jgi:adenine-specific DNA-methyltransferase
MNSEFNEQTLKYVEKTDLAYRKQRGQYFTPRSIRNELLLQLPKDKVKPRILDPACGTGEFLISAEEFFPDAEVEGWDIDHKLVEIAGSVAPKSRVYVKDSLKEKCQGTYDFIIGNPPYYEFSPGSSVKNKFEMLLNGRTNIFSLFIKLGLDLLKEGGHLAYVVPPSMNNGAYFSKVREYIINNSNIEFLKIIDNTSLFHDALQMTMLLVLRKGKNRGDYLFEHNGITIFCENPAFLKRSFHGTRSLKDLGFSVKTGRLIWNQNKELLTNKAKEGVPLLWAHNISASGLIFPVTGKKPQYVRTKSYDEGPAIIVNRITGASRTAKIRSALVPEKMKFIAENHCNVIFPPKKGGQLDLRYKGSSSRSEPVTLGDVYEQLASPKKLIVMQNITGNTQISKTELENLFPISI